jgi:hypothetical protein
MKLHKILITINLKVEKYIHKIFFLFLNFFNIYLKIHYQKYQNNPLTSDPHPLNKKIVSNILPPRKILTFDRLQSALRLATLLVNAND